MSWLPILLLGVVTFAATVLLLKLPKAGWTLFGAALLFGLTGYAVQGWPEYPGAPKAAAVQVTEGNELMIEARRVYFDPESIPSRFVTVADAFARKGQYQDAANMLRNAVQDDPRDVEAWVAMGNALVEHAAGSLTPPAMYAYARAERIDPANPAPKYFLGIAHLRNGRPLETRNLWAQMLEDAPEDAEWRPDMQLRLDRLDQLLAQTAAQQ